MHAWNRDWVKLTPHIGGADDGLPELNVTKRLVPQNLSHKTAKESEIPPITPFRNHTLQSLHWNKSVSPLTAWLLAHELPVALLRSACVYLFGAGCWEREEGKDWMWGNWWQSLLATQHWVGERETIERQSDVFHSVALCFPYISRFNRSHFPSWGSEGVDWNSSFLHINPRSLPCCCSLFGHLQRSLNRTPVCGPAAAP